MRKADDWTIEHWRTEPRLVGLEFPDASVDEVPPLWKDLTTASVLAVLLWGVAAIVFGWNTQKAALGRRRLVRHVMPSLSAKPFLVGARPVHRHPFLLEHLVDDDVAAVHDLHLYRHARR